MSRQTEESSSSRGNVWRRVRKAPRASIVGAAAMALVIPLILTGCGSPAAGDNASGATSAESVAISFSNDPATTGYDPAAYANGGGGGEATFWEGLYNSLFASTSDGSIKPSLATSYSFNADKTVLTLKLRTGVTFTDGSKLSASLVKENLDRRSDPALLAYSAFAKGGASEIANVGAPNATTVVITFAEPAASAVSLLADTSGRIVGQNAIDDPASLKTTPDGSGPYTLSSATVRGNTYTLVKNPKSWDASSYPYRNVSFKVLTDSQSQANALVSGQVQIAQVDSTTQATVKSRAKIVEFPGAVYGFILFDKLGKISKPFADVRVRQALSLAIDRKAVAAVNDGATPTANAFPKGTNGYDPSLDTTYALDLAKAKQLLTEAGYPHGFSFDTLVGGTMYSVDLQAIKAQWAKIGVTMNIQQVSEPQKAPTTTPLGYFNFFPGTDPLGFVNGFLLAGGVNPQHASDPAITSAVNAAERGGGNSDVEALTQLNNAIVNEGWILPVYTKSVMLGYDSAKVAAPALASPTTSPLLSGIVPAK